MTGSTQYNQNKSSLESSVHNDYLSYSLTPEFNLNLSERFKLHTDLNYTLQQKTQTFPTDFSRTVWNAFLQESFFKGNRLALKFYVNDLLNQNTGFDRSAYNNTITQNRYTTIKRYFLFSLIWTFNQTYETKTQKD